MLSNLARVGVEGLQVLPVLHLDVGERMKHDLLRDRGADASEHEESRLDRVVRPDRLGGVRHFPFLLLCSPLVVFFFGGRAQPREDVDDVLAEVAVVPGDEGVEALRLDVLEAAEEDGVAETVLGERQSPPGEDAAGADLAQLGVAEGPHALRPAVAIVVNDLGALAAALEARLDGVQGGGDNALEGARQEAGREGLTG